jgi:hypothetical protein
MLKHSRRQFLQSSVGIGAVVGLSAATPQLSTMSSAATPAHADQVNPAVVPGLVRWHQDFQAACTAAGASGKPVFLLHMLGRLDQQFC